MFKLTNFNSKVLLNAIDSNAQIKREKFCEYYFESGDETLKTNQIVLKRTCPIDLQDSPCFVFDEKNALLPLEGSFWVFQDSKSSSQMECSIDIQQDLDNFQKILKLKNPIKLSQMCIVERININDEIFVNFCSIPTGEYERICYENHSESEEEEQNPREIEMYHSYITTTNESIENKLQPFKIVNAIDFFVIDGTCYGLQYFGFKNFRKQIQKKTGIEI